MSSGKDYWLGALAVTIVVTENACNLSTWLLLLFGSINTLSDIMYTILMPFTDNAKQQVQHRNSALLAIVCYCLCVF